MAAMMSMFSGMMNGGQVGANLEGDSSEEKAQTYFAGMTNGNGENGANPMAAMMSMFGGMMGGGEGGANPMAAMGGMFGGGDKKEEPAEGECPEEPKEEE